MGDLLLIHDTGAHSLAMGFNYNGRLRPQELLLRADGSVELIRRAEEVRRDYFATLQFEPDVLVPGAPSGLRRARARAPRDGAPGTGELSMATLASIADFGGLESLREQIDCLWERRSELDDRDAHVQATVLSVIDLLDCGRVRVAELDDDGRGAGARVAQARDRAAVPRLPDGAHRGRPDAVRRPVAAEAQQPQRARRPRRLCALRLAPRVGLDPDAELRQRRRLRRPRHARRHVGDGRLVRADRRPRAPLRRRRRGRGARAAAGEPGDRRARRLHRQPLHADRRSARRRRRRRRRRRDPLADDPRDRRRHAARRSRAGTSRRGAWRSARAARAPSRAATSACRACSSSSTSARASATTRSSSTTLVRDHGAAL